MADLLDEALSERPSVPEPSAWESQPAPPPPTLKRRPRKDSVWPVVSALMFAFVTVGGTLVFFADRYAEGRLYGWRFVAPVIWVTYYLAAAVVLVHALREGLLYGLAYLFVPLFDLYYAFTRCSQIGLAAVLKILGKLLQLVMIGLLIWLAQSSPHIRERLRERIEEDSYDGLDRQSAPIDGPQDLPKHEPNILGGSARSPRDRRTSAAREAKTQIGIFRGALERYAMDIGGYPTSEQGLKALVEKPTGAGSVSGNWDGPYIDASMVPKDPWGQEYRYEYPSAHNNDGSPAIWSCGPDARSGTEDDIISWIASTQEFRSDGNGHAVICPKCRKVIGCVMGGMQSGTMSCPDCGMEVGVKVE